MISREAKRVVMPQDDREPNAGQPHEQSKQDNLQAVVKAINALWQEIAGQFPSEYYDLEMIYSEQESGEANRKSIQPLKPGWQEGSAEAVMRGDRTSLAALLTAEALLSSPWLAYVEQYSEGRADTAATWLLALHESLFPHGFYNGMELLMRLNEQRVIFALAGEVQGYIYVEADPEFGEGRIEFLGVAPQHRGRGVGQALVTAAVRWLFSFADIREITLLCSSDNSGAIAFYRRQGFQLVHIINSYISPSSIDPSEP